LFDFFTPCLNFTLKRALRTNSGALAESLSEYKISPGGKKREARYVVPPHLLVQIEHAEDRKYGQRNNLLDRFQLNCGELSIAPLVDGAGRPAPAFSGFEIFNNGDNTLESLDKSYRVY